MSNYLKVRFLFLHTISLINKSESPRMGPNKHLKRVGNSLKMTQKMKSGDRIQIQIQLTTKLTINLTMVSTEMIATS